MAGARSSPRSTPPARRSRHKSGIRAWCAGRVPVRGQLRQFGELRRASDRAGAVLATGHTPAAALAAADRAAARIRFVTGRIEGFRARAIEAGARLRIWQERAATDYHTGREAGLALLAHDKLDGVFCVTDLLALGFLDAARYERDRSVPDDLSVIGFDNIPQAAWSAYRLTTFNQPVADLASAVVNAIHRRTEHPRATHRLATVPVRLVVRSTVRGLAAPKASL